MQAGRLHWRDERGMSMIELLIVILIVAVLTALAAGTFVEQRKRAEDRRATEAARTVRLAMEIHFHDHGSYAATRADLEELEPTIRSVAGLQLSATASTYTITVPSASGPDGGGPFTVERRAGGELRRGCGNPGHGSCRAEPDAQGNSW
jgi:prepilin-type N-terminal cleavage/methylation domain-containing protein